MHTLLNLREAISTFIHISDGKMGVVKVLDMLPIVAEALYIMDRDYLDFGRLFKLYEAGVYFAT